MLDRVWQFFHFEPDKISKAVCNVCKQPFNSNGPQNVHLVDHLRKTHPDLYGKLLRINSNNGWITKKHFGSDLKLLGRINVLLCTCTCTDFIILHRKIHLLKLQQVQQQQIDLICPFIIPTMHYNLKIGFFGKNMFDFWVLKLELECHWN